MAVYSVVDATETFDLSAVASRRRRVVEAAQKYGGRVKTDKGAPQIVLEFENSEQAKRWYDSTEYRSLRSLLRRAFNGFGRGLS